MVIFHSYVSLPEGIGGGQIQMEDLTRFNCEQ